MWSVLDLSGDAITGCTWPIIDTCNDFVCSDPAIAMWADQMAVEVLYAASGRQYGLCKSTIRPCMQSCSNGQFYEGSPVLAAAANSLTDWAWSLVTCGQCAKRSCACTRVSQVVLPWQRIQEVLEVQVDGEILDPSQYRLAGRRLIRKDGGVWPKCQDDAVDNYEVGSWSARVVHGRKVPVGGQMAGGVYSCEIAKSLSGADCELPQRVQSITRQGVSIAFVDPMDFLEKGKTGLYVVDTWLMAVNPSGLRRPPAVYRADAW